MKKYLWLRVSHELAADDGAGDGGTIAVESRGFIDLILDQEFKEVSDLPEDFRQAVDAICMVRLGYAPRDLNYVNDDEDLKDPTVVVASTEAYILDIDVSGLPVDVRVVQPTHDDVHEVAAVNSASLFDNAWVEFMGHR
mgnify:CR=1 FL=1